MWSEDVRIRRVAKGDGPALERFYAELSTRSRSLRFHGQCPSIGATRAENLAAADHRRRDGFVAVAGETIVGHLMLEPDGEATEEMAVAVSDRFQGHGVGTLLVAAGNASGRLRGIRRFVAWVLPENLAMRHLLAGSPHGVRTEWIGSVLRCELDLPTHARASSRPI